MLRFLARLLFDPSRHPIPAPNPGVKKGPAPVKYIPKPQNLVLDPDGNPRVFNDLGNDTFTWENFEGAKSSRKKAHTSTDATQVKLGGLNETKYLQYKALWAEGCTAVMASKRLTKQHGRGYGERTSYQYFAAINRAARLSPSGRSAVQPAK